MTISISSRGCQGLAETTTPLEALPLILLLFLTSVTGEEGDLLPRVSFFRVVLSDDKTHDNRDER